MNDELMRLYHRTVVAAAFGPEDDEHDRLFTELVHGLGALADVDRVTALSEAVKDDAEVLAEATA